MDGNRLDGVFTAIVTPFRDDCSIDESALRTLVDRQAEASVNGIVACGTTGEASSLTPEEHQQVVEVIVDQAANRMHVMAGAGAVNSRQAIELSRRCEDAGATSLLHVTPSYVKPTQTGLLRHFESILEAVTLPVMLYNVPGRTASTIQPRTALRLAEHDQVLGIKQAVADLQQLDQILEPSPQFVCRHEWRRFAGARDDCNGCRWSRLCDW